MRYATSDGTATAGADYVAASGALRFGPGQRSRTVSVRVLDDAHDEGAETMTLRLSAPYGAAIADGTATGTIDNTDAMPAAWLARFGRTVSTQVVEAVEARIAGDAGGSRHPEAVGGFQGRQQPAFVQPLMAGLESVVVPDHLYQHRIEGVAVSASVPALVENRCDLAIGVVVQQPVDLGNDLVTGLVDLTREWTRFPGELSGRAAAQPHPQAPRGLGQGTGFEADRGDPVRQLAHERNQRFRCAGDPRLRHDLALLAENADCRACQRYIQPDKNIHVVCMDASRNARIDLGVTGRQIAVLYPAFGAGLSARWP